jgi:hypothetical protein
MKPATEPRAPGAALMQAGAGPQIGKRYGDKTSGIEVLCSKPGNSELAIGGRPLVLKEARLLPTTD